MQTVQQVENTVSEVLRASAFADSVVQPRTRVEEFGGHISVEVVLADATQADAAKAAIEKSLGQPDIFLTVRGIWKIEEVSQPEIAYGTNGSPRAAVLVPVIMRSGDMRHVVTVSVTKLAEMELQRILGYPPDLRQIARLVVENKLKLGGGSFWDPTADEWLEVASGNVADLSRSLRRTA